MTKHAIRCHVLRATLTSSSIIGKSTMENPWLYAVLVFGIIVLPGMDMAFVLASSLANGRRAGFAAVAGMVVGGFAHTVMSALGIGLLLKLFPIAFNAMLFAGCAYVIWMGIAIARSASAMSGVAETHSRTHRQTFARAVLTCLLNPKAYLFMIAVFPQFLRPDAGPLWPLWLQAVVLFAIGAASQIVVYGSVALAASRVRDWLASSSASQIMFARAIGGLLIATALWTLWTGWR
jgi:threonine/homoserine/homoserine lactone efflux protein